MKIQVDGNELFELLDWEKQVVCNDISEDDFESDMKRRLEYILKHKVEQCYKRFFDEWLPKLQQDESVLSIPKSREDFVKLVCSRKDYKCRKARELESKK